MVHVLEKYLKPRKRSSMSSCDQDSDLEEPASKTVALLNLFVALNCVSGDLKWKNFRGKTPGPLTSQAVPLPELPPQTKIPR